jgi:hypothetical protein
MAQDAIDAVDVLRKTFEDGTEKIKHSKFVYILIEDIFGPITLTHSFSSDEQECPEMNVQSMLYEMPSALQKIQEWWEGAHEGSVSTNELDTLGHQSLAVSFHF